ncbi:MULTISPECIES: dihydrofolate reductase [Actinomyces]|uniref:dihydrofolate reductase n=1 Tax=Actinomyces respiraculi TaxID=2744574 RepID=A0A7T0PXX0_9ACTO|nr:MULTISPECIES: dihydrofolate reductase [Actinomyces]QPL06040.1 dihydrofolate reductase [Actinomyces respiraculi]
MSTRSASRAPVRVGAVWAQDRAGIIGADGDMLWHVPADFRHFKAATTGGVVLMGRTTWDSLGASLPGRLSVVLTRREHWGADGVACAVPTLAEGLDRGAELLAGLGEDPRQDVYRALPRLWVIGGGSVYRQALEAEALDELLVSVIDVDAAATVRARGLSPDALVRVPDVAAGAGPQGHWVAGGPLSDAPGAWRPVSGDAAWRVDHYRRR